MMEFYEVLKNRKSYRGYDSLKQIPDDVLARIGAAVNLAPTACNRQPIRFLLVRDAALREKICNVYTQPWLKEAPAILVALEDESQAWHRLEGESASVIDAAIAMEHFVLAAAAEGLGTCWICAFKRDDMDQALNIEKPWRTVAISPLGYAKADACRNTGRKPQNEIFQVID